MGHVECRLIHACSFFSMIGQHVCMDCVVCVTVKLSFACASRWGIALVGFVSTERSSPRHGTPLSGIGHVQAGDAP